MSIYNICPNEKIAYGTFSEAIINYFGVECDWYLKKLIESEAIVKKDKNNFYCYLLFEKREEIFFFEIISSGNNINDSRIKEIFAATNLEDNLAKIINKKIEELIV